MSSFRKPPALTRGDRIAVIAPSGPFNRESFDAGLALLAARYRPELSAGLFDRHRYLAGDDSRRLAELNAALIDSEIKAVFCARGGYGAMRLLSRLAPIPPDTPIKPLIGFSDITALHAWLQAQGIVSFHGPNATQLARVPETSRERLFRLLEVPANPAPLSGTATYVGGTAEGPLVGGNLSVLASLVGTPFLPELNGAILMLEDVGERPYRLDRMWTQLALAGVFDQLAGVVLGTFTGCEEKEAGLSAGYSSDNVLRELANAAGLPCAAGFPIGHGDDNETVPLGVRVRLDADSRRLEFMETATAGADS